MSGHDRVSITGFRKLEATAGAVLVEGNAWGDRFWGSVEGSGQNWLGRLLMEIREVTRCGSAVP